MGNRYHSPTARPPDAGDYADRRPDDVRTRTPEQPPTPDDADEEDKADDPEEADDESPSDDEPDTTQQPLDAVTPAATEPDSDSADGDDDTAPDPDTEPTASPRPASNGDETGDSTPTDEVGHHRDLYHDQFGAPTIDLPTHLDPRPAGGATPVPSATGRHAADGALHKADRPDGTTVYLKQPGARSRYDRELGVNAVCHAAAADALDARTCDVAFDVDQNVLYSEGIDGTSLDDVTPADLSDDAVTSARTTAATAMLIGDWDLDPKNFHVTPTDDTVMVDLDEFGAPIQPAAAHDRHELAGERNYAWVSPAAAGEFAERLSFLASDGRSFATAEEFTALTDTMTTVAQSVDDPTAVVDDVRETVADTLPIEMAADPSDIPEAERGLRHHIDQQLAMLETNIRAAQAENTIYHDADLYQG